MVARQCIGVVVLDRIKVKNTSSWRESGFSRSESRRRKQLVKEHCCCLSKQLRGKSNCYRYCDYSTGVSACNGIVQSVRGKKESHGNR